jgi:hypothetical protein
MSRFPVAHETPRRPPQSQLLAPDGPPSVRRLRILRGVAKEVTLFVLIHASIVDNGLPARVVSQAHGIDLRYALKSELQSLPTLDLGARWVPTCFVNRGSGAWSERPDTVRGPVCEERCPDDPALGDGAPVAAVV